MKPNFMKAPRTPNSPRRFIILAVSGAALLILGGSLIALDQIGIGPRVLAQYINEGISRLAGADLIVKADQTLLPADGQTHTVIQASSTNLNLPITAQLLSGSGTIATTASSPGAATFTYAAGTITGEAIVLIKSGSLTQEVKFTLAEAVTPATPVITAPPDGSTTSDPKPEIAGTGPASTKILITDNGTSNTATQTDDKGNFRIQLEHPLYSGKHTLAAVAQNYLGVVSATSNLVTITVKAEPVQLDLAHLRTSPSKIAAGASFGLFVPASLNTARVTAELQGKIFELQDLHHTSIFSGTLPAPDQPGSFTLNFITYDAAGNATRFDRAANLTIISS